MRYNTGMRFEVPQFIEIEDKIVGPLTWRQFIYVAGGVGISVILFLSISSFLLSVIFIIPVIALSSALAFHRVNNRPFSIFLEALVNYMTKNKLYLWKKNEQQSIIEKTYQNTVSGQDLSPTQDRGLSSLTRKIEHHLPE